MIEVNKDDLARQTITSSRKSAAKVVALGRCNGDGEPLYTLKYQSGCKGTRKWTRKQLRGAGFCFPKEEKEEKVKKKEGAQE